MNTRACERCGRGHWQDRKLCSECTDKECEVLSRPLLDRYMKKHIEEQPTDPKSDLIDWHEAPPA